jgi:hypothetical protein
MIVDFSTFGTLVAAEGVRGYDGWTEAEVSRAVSLAQEWLLAHTDREFEATTEERLFSGNDMGGMDLPDVLEVEKVEVGGSEVSDYRLLPLNGLPKTRVVRTSGTWPAPSTASELGNVAITGTWGYAATPPKSVVRAVFLMSLVCGQTGGVVTNPATAQWRSVSGLNLSFTRASGGEATRSLTTIVGEAEREVAHLVDHTGRRSRTLR